MSQVAKIRRVSFRGVPVYLGEHQGTPMFSGNPERVAQWMCDGYRTRFNQHRSTRSKYVYADGARVLNLDGTPMLKPIGNTVTTITDKQAREQFPHLAAIPSMVLQAPTKIENAEWFAAAKRRKAIGGAMPRFRSRKRELKFSCWFNGGTNAVFHHTGRRSGMLVIRGQNPVGVSRKGRWELRFHVRVSQPIREYTSVQVDMLSKQVVFINPAPVADRSNANGSVGIDRGVTHSAVTSDGEFFDVPETVTLDHTITHLQKRMAKSRTTATREGRDWRSSSRYAATRTRCAKAQARRAATKNDAVHAFSKRIAETYTTVVVEALAVKTMSKKGKHKRGLNRGIRNARWSTLLNQLQYKIGTSVDGEPFVFAVDPAYTSQRCAKCGHIERSNRESQAVFRCAQCSHTDNADVNAAINIVVKHFQGWTNPAWSKHKTGDTSVLPAAALKRKPPVPASS